MRIQIRQVNASQDGMQQFVVVHDGKQTDPVKIKDPWEAMVGTQNLKQGLLWYLEEFLDLPIDGFRDRAGEVRQALSKWGQDCFNTLFECGWSRD